MNKFRTHTCGELTKKFTKKDVILSGWINKKRDHGNLLFIDLRDHYGITQCVIDKENKFFKELEKLQLETARVERGSAIAIEELQAKSSLLAATQQRVSSNGQYLSSVSKFRNLFGEDPIMKDLLVSEVKITGIVENKEEAFKQALLNNGNLIISDL